MGVYTPPKLHLGGTLLPLTGSNHIFTCDSKWLSTFCGRPVMGILGRDVLEHYCIQLDFASHRKRFLDPDTPAKKWGQPFVLTGPPGEEIYVSNNLVGNQGSASLTAIRASEMVSWKLQKAWRTDQDGKTIEEYPVP